MWDVCLLGVRTSVCVKANELQWKRGELLLLLLLMRCLLESMASLGQACESYTNNPSLPTTESRRDKWCSKEHQGLSYTLGHGHGRVQSLQVECDISRLSLLACHVTGLQPDNRTRALSCVRWEANGLLQRAVLPCMSKPMLTRLIPVLFWHHSQARVSVRVAPCGVLSRG